MHPFDFSLRTRVVFGDDVFARLGELARELGFTRALLVADRGIVATGQVDRAAALLDAHGVRPFTFHDFDANPDSRMRPPTLAAKLSPVPRKYVGYTRGR